MNKPNKRADLDEVRERIRDRRMKEQLGSNAARLSDWQKAEKTRETTDMLQQLADEVAYWRALAEEEPRDGEPMEPNP